MLQAVIRELQSILKELVLDKVSPMFFPLIMLSDCRRHPNIVFIKCYLLLIAFICICTVIFAGRLSFIPNPAQSAFPINNLEGLSTVCLL